MCEVNNEEQLKATNLEQMFENIKNNFVEGLKVTQEKYKTAEVVVPFEVLDIVYARALQATVFSNEFNAIFSENISKVITNISNGDECTCGDEHCHCHEHE